ncbi:MAG: hypothetical protein KDD33_04760 [Bdellovibrionales bacterium]|nr:hypothetical protein [Bdellovibrionales bacterium]
MNKVTTGLLFFITFISAVLFQNCGGPSHSGSVSKGSGTDDDLSKKSCEVILQEAYRDTFHSFALENRCNHCHVVGGAGKSAFAQPDYIPAMDAFIGLGGAEKFALKAVSDHQSGYTGPHLAPSVSDNVETWSAAVDSYNSCGQDQVENPEVRYVTSEKLINLINANGTPKTSDEFQKITWDLSQEDFSANAVGAEFSISVMYTERFKGIPVYVFTFPTLKTGNQTITILGVNVVINGEKYGRTTFDFKSVTLAPNSTIQLSNIGLDLQPENGEFITAGDVVQIEFDYFIVN